MLGIGGWLRGPRGLDVDASEVTEAVLLGVCAWEAILLTPSGTATGSGGGKGDMEMADIEAEWAW